MNCSMVYCFTAAASAGFGGDFFLLSGVCFVSNALLETSGFCSIGGFWASAFKRATAAQRPTTRNDLLAAPLTKKVFKFIGFRFLEVELIAPSCRKAKRSIAEWLSCA